MYERVYACADVYMCMNFVENRYRRLKEVLLRRIHGIGRLPAAVLIRHALPLCDDLCLLSSFCSGDIPRIDHDGHLVLESSFDSIPSHLHSKEDVLVCLQLDPELSRASFDSLCALIRSIEGTKTSGGGARATFRSRLLSSIVK